MEQVNSYVYFALTGEYFDLQHVTEKIGITPTECWNKGEKGKYKPSLDYSCWQLSTDKRIENIIVDRLVDELIEQLFDKIEIINELKKQFNLNSKIEIVMYIDINEEQPTPAFGQDLRTIEFLHRTKTITDMDIYRFNSAEK
jgi:hypothetical protein